VSGFTRTQGIGPIRPQAPQRNPEQPMKSVQPRARLLALKNGKLLPKGSSLQDEIVPRYQKRRKYVSVADRNVIILPMLLSLDNSRFETLPNLSCS
jgi:hypothetical protein